MNCCLLYFVTTFISELRNVELATTTIAASNGSSSRHNLSVLPFILPSKFLLSRIASCTDLIHVTYYVNYHHIVLLFVNLLIWWVVKLFNLSLSSLSNAILFSLVSTATSNLATFNCAIFKFGFQVVLHTKVHLLHKFQNN